MSLHRRLAALRDDRSLGTLLGRLVEDGKEAACAEVAVAKAKVTERVNAYKGAAILFAAAGILAFAALIALLVGIEIALGTVIGVALATVVVVGVTLILTTILVVIGRSRLAPSAGERA